MIRSDEYLRLLMGRKCKMRKGTSLSSNNKCKHNIFEQNQSTKRKGFMRKKNQEKEVTFCSKDKVSTRWEYAWTK